MRGPGHPIRPPGALASCSAPLADELARWTFDETTPRVAGAAVADASGRHLGAIVAAAEPGITVVDGPPGCGHALAFSAGDRSGYVEVPNAPEWSQPAGSVDFWFRAQTCPSDLEGIVARDAKYQLHGGHLRVLWIPGCRIAVRSQMLSLEQTTASDVEVTTSDPIELDRWTHVALNFGAPGIEIYVDGVRAGFAPLAWGTEGNERPWVFGASNDTADEATNEGVTRPLHAASLDNVRISARRQPF